eukprot:TRINITY_DN14456_c0_g1_i1.p1 TRINITY_DN14456_c0_g1~~TRINITY_DN14456_c0_g1_i1.p1  ORF type:complete len:408 (+),score=138.96 TRINITY_DN14456_c0_g1_i1:129-1226(+)
MAADATSPSSTRSPGRLAIEEAAQLVSEEWAPHEAQMHKVCEIERSSPPRWVANLVSYPDLGPSDSMYAMKNRNRPATAPTHDPGAELAAINERLSVDEQEKLPGEGDGWKMPPDAPPPLQVLYARSETRTPLIVPCSLLGCSQSEAVSTIQTLARLRVEGATVLDLNAEAQKGVDLAAAASDRVQKCLENGHWLIVAQSSVRRPYGQGDTACGEMATFPAYRQLALALMCAQPEGDRPSGLFRLWVVVPEPVDLDDTNFPTFPTLFVQNALQLKPSEAQQTKVVRKLPADPMLLETEVAHRERRRQQGREVDAESLDGADNQCDERKLTGPIFVRSAEMFRNTSPERIRARTDFADSLGSGVTA